MSYDLSFYKLATGKTIEEALAEEEQICSQLMAGDARAASLSLSEVERAALASEVERILAPSERVERHNVVEFTAEGLNLQCAIYAASVAVTWPMTLEPAQGKAVNARVDRLVDLFSSSGLTGYDQQLGCEVGAHDAENREQVREHAAGALKRVLSRPWWKLW